jgi:ABC-type transport system involved in multi-copper enzyme maturation permease subunit
MLSAREVGLVAQRELLRNLRSAKGIAMFVLFFLGGAVPSVVEVLFFRIVNADTREDAPEELRRAMFEQVLASPKFIYSYDEATAKYLSHCPSSIFLFLFKGMLYVLPLMILMIGFEQLAGEIQHRSIRYVAGRARRSSIVVGKALGVWGVVSIMALVLHVTVWVVILVRGGENAGNVLSWGIRVWLFGVADAAAYVGLTALVSSWFRTPIVALFVGIALFFGLWLTSVILGAIKATQVAAWAFPGTYERLLSSPEPMRVLGGCAALLAWGAVMVALTALVVERRDI